MSQFARASRRSAVPLAALLFFSACSSDVVAPRDPVAAPTARVSADVSPVGVSAGGLTFATDSGAFTLDLVHSAIIGPDGTISTLAPDAMAYFIAAHDAIAQADAIAQQIAKATQAKNAPCNPRLQACGPAAPVSLPGRPGLGGMTAFSTGTPSYSVESGTLGDPNVPFTCRDISTEMMQLMPAYRNARTAYLAALAGLGTAALYGIGRIPLKPQAPGQPFFAPPTDLKGLYALYSAKYGAPFLYEVALSNYEFQKTQLGILGTLFNAQDCLTASWAPAPHTPPAPGSGGGGGGDGGTGGGSSMTCYFNVTTVDGVEVYRSLWYCDAS